jgi:hypothetical protein
MRRSKAVLGILSAAIVLGLGQFSPPRPAIASQSGGSYRAASPEYGMSVFLYGNPDTTTRDLEMLTALGFGWQKSLFSWRNIEGECKGCFTWDESDRVVWASAEAGLKIVARLDFQPWWARSDGASNGPPDNYQDFADFVRAFVDRYKQGSEFGTVHAIQVWNEVNLDREWGGGPMNRQSAADYVRLLSMAYRAAKAADPTVTVVSAGLSPNGVSASFAQPDDVYLRWMYESGLRGNFDVLGANANVQCPCVDASPGTVAGFSHPSFYFRRVEQLRAIMMAYGDTSKQVWLMEFGWTTDTVNPGYAWYATTEERKAELIVEAFRFANQRWSPWIGMMALWTIAAPHWEANDEQVWWAVTNPDGTTRPAYDRLLNARARGELPLLRPAPTPEPALDEALALTGEAPVTATEEETILASVSAEAVPTAPPVATVPATPTALAIATSTPTAIGPPKSPTPVRATGSPTVAVISTTPSVTPTTSVAATPTPASPRFRVAGTNGEGLSLRRSPSSTAPRIKILTDGTVLQSLGVTQRAEGRDWRQVRDPDAAEGWVATEYLVPA